MASYPAVFTKQKGEYTIFFPDFAATMMEDGESVDSVMDAAKELIAMKAYTSDSEMPKPSSLEDVEAMLAKGAYGNAENAVVKLVDVDTEKHIKDHFG
jgi:predicted RNase H-like HicB family nuclease